MKTDRLTRILAAASALAGPLMNDATGQGPAGPGALWPAIQNFGLSPAAIGVADVRQVHMIPDPVVQGAGPYICALTVTGLPPGLGGIGGSDVLLGTYDPVFDMFWPNMDAAALNTPGQEFALSLHSSGLLATYEMDGVVQLAQRAVPNGPFMPLGPVFGLPQQQWYDPALADIDGELHLLFTEVNTIVAAPLDVVAMTIDPLRTVPLVQPARAGSIANSATPIVDERGQLVGVSHHDLLLDDNDHYIAFDLDPATPSFITVDTPGWINNGGFVGGRFFSAESAPLPYHVIEADFVWMPSRNGHLGEDVFLGAFSGLEGIAGPVQSIPMLLLAVNFLPVPFQFPGVVGALGVDPATMVTIPGNQNPVLGIGTVMHIPQIPALAGAQLPIQTALIGPNIALTNTATLNVRSNNQCDRSVRIPPAGQIIADLGFGWLSLPDCRTSNPGVCAFFDASQQPGQAAIGLIGLARGQATVRAVWDDGNGMRRILVFCINVP